LSRYSLCHYPLDQLTSINLNNTDDFHTPEELAAKVEKILESFGHSTARDQPFSGTIVPMKHYRKDERVQSMMIEINRWLYLGEDYSVDSERTKTLIEVLRRVAEVLEEN
jgi:N-formylglutamate amidohydrolase